MRRHLRLILISGAIMAVAGPAWAEHAAARRIDQAFSDCRDACQGAVDIDFGGLSIRGLSMSVGRTAARAERLRVEPHLDGIHVVIEGLDARIDRQGRDTASPTPATEAAQAPARGPRTNPLAGVPLKLETEGRVTITGPAGTEVVVIDPSLDIDALGRPSARMSGQLRRHGATVATASELVAHAEGLRADTWSASGRVAFGKRQERPLPFEAEVGHAAASVRLASAEGTAEIELSWGPTPRVMVDAHSFGLGVGLTSLLPSLPEEVRIDVEQATLDGRVTIERSADGASARLESVRVSKMVIDAPPLSKDPLYMQTIGVDGSVDLVGQQVRADLDLTHGHVATELRGHVSRDDVNLSLSLAPLPCQALLESMPHGFIPMLEGMQMVGEVDALVHVEFEFEALARARAQAGNDEVDTRGPAPGTIEFDFPFLDRCEVVRDAPGVDLEALRGNYRHRFLSAAGTENIRILSPGAAGFVTVAGSPRLAQAFVVLEDTRFWHHDGFDREQIERAFWHNLGVKGFSRGASTITQQTARNLWLGHDRSLGRKLQEAMLTARLERELSKRRILEIYMNIIELGPEVHGVHEAALFHFDRPPHQLNVLETLHIASLAPAPVRFSRRFAVGEVDPAWRARLEQQVHRLVIHRMLARDRAPTALREPLRLRIRTG